MPDKYTSGFVSIVGRPNAGKSTLLNALVGSKLAIVADKPQTTRSLVQGVWHGPGAQIVFLDTPGIHRPDSVFNRRMMQMLREALDERDLLVYIADATLPFQPAEADAIEVIAQSATPAILALNKIDRLSDKSRLLPLIESYKNAWDFADYLPISALTGAGVEELRKAILDRLPEGPPYFPEDYLTDQPERFLAAELIRERILHETRQEVPHAVAVLIDEWEEKPHITRIAASIYVERDGQKGIIIGAGGSMLKKIGTLAREEMERMFGRRIYLELFVKVQPQWRKDPRFLDELDWRRMLGGEGE
ncbi:MAG: GTPase Era [bacterium]|jgi:GTP-binding protein Era